jgi:hypothetical protein
MRGRSLIIRKRSKRAKPAIGRNRPATDGPRQSQLDPVKEPDARRLAGKRRPSLNQKLAPLRAMLRKHADDLRVLHEGERQLRLACIRYENLNCELRNVCVMHRAMIDDLKMTGAGATHELGIPPS